MRPAAMATTTAMMIQSGAHAPVDVQQNLTVWLARSSHLGTAGLTVRIICNREESLWNHPLLAIRVRDACPTRPKGDAYSVGGSGKGEQESWRRL